MWSCGEGRCTGHRLFLLFFWIFCFVRAADRNEICDHSFLIHCWVSANRKQTLSRNLSCGSESVASPAPATVPVSGSRGVVLRRGGTAGGEDEPTSSTCDCAVSMPAVPYRARACRWRCRKNLTSGGAASTRGWKSRTWLTTGHPPCRLGPLELSLLQVQSHHRSWTPTSTRRPG